MEILGPEATEARLAYPELAETIRTVALAGAVHAPPRLALPLTDGALLLVMPASDGDIAITKLVTVHPENTRRGLPTIQGEMIVMDAATGTRLGILDGAVATARRTAALSLLAAKELAPRPDGPLLLIGAGTQGRAHLEAFREGLGTPEVSVSSRTTQRAEELVRHARALGMKARTVRDPGEALGEASLVATATTSREPVLPEDTPDDAFIAAVGSFEPEAAEIPPAVISRSTVVVDTVEGAEVEAGDLIQAENEGAFSWEAATPLAEALNWSERPTSAVVFKSVGHARWDLAAARTAFRS